MHVKVKDPVPVADVSERGCSEGIRAHNFYLYKRASSWGISSMKNFFHDIGIPSWHRVASLYFANASHHALNLVLS